MVVSLQTWVGTITDLLVINRPITQQSKHTAT